MTIASELLVLASTKTAIAVAIAAKGVPTTGSTFAQYADLIALISSGAPAPTGANFVFP